MTQPYIDDRVAIQRAAEEAGIIACYTAIKGDEKDRFRRIGLPYLESLPLQIETPDLPVDLVMDRYGPSVYRLAFRRGMDTVALEAAAIMMEYENPAPIPAQLAEHLRMRLGLVEDKNGNVTLI
jgi:hypothetical protein